jgi:hypothetical protein
VVAVVVQVLLAPQVVAVVVRLRAEIFKAPWALQLVDSRQFLAISVEQALVVLLQVVA